MCFIFLVPQFCQYFPFCCYWTPDFRICCQEWCRVGTDRWFNMEQKLVISNMVVNKTNYLNNKSQNLITFKLNYEWNFLEPTKKQIIFYLPEKRFKNDSVMLGLSLSFILFPRVMWEVYNSLVKRRSYHHQVILSP